MKNSELNEIAKSLGAKTWSDLTDQQLHEITSSHPPEVVAVATKRLQNNARRAQQAAKDAAQAEQRAAARALATKQVDAIEDVPPPHEPKYIRPVDTVPAPASPLTSVGQSPQWIADVLVASGIDGLLGGGRIKIAAKYLTDGEYITDYQGMWRDLSAAVLPIVMPAIKLQQKNWEKSRETELLAGRKFAKLTVAQLSAICNGDDPDSVPAKFHNRLYDLRCKAACAAAGLPKGNTRTTTSKRQRLTRR